MDELRLKRKEKEQMASIHDFTGNDKDDTSGTGGSTGGTPPNNTGGGGNPQGGMFIPPQLQSGGNSGATDVEMDMLINYNEMAKDGQFSEAFFRDGQIMQILSILNTKKHPNALIVGDAGVGKTQIVEELARRLVSKDPIVCGMLKGVTIYELPLGKIVSGSSYVGQLEQKLYEVIEFAQNPKNKAIIFIDEIHQIMESNSKTYGKIAQILKPALGRGSMRAIGATTTQEATTFMDDPAFSRRWSTVQIPELSVDETREIIYNVRDMFQKHHKVLLPDDVIDHAVPIGDEYKQYGSHRPDSTITLIDKAMSDARVKRLELVESAKINPALNHIITAQPNPVLTVGQLKQSALTLLTGDDKLFEENAEKLEDTLNNQIIGQDEAKVKINDTVKRLGLGLIENTRPASFLFAGASGTGKTEIAKQIAEAIFGSKEKMIYINMSEYSNPASMTRIIGSSAGYVGSDSKTELPFDVLENNPYQLVVLDEFEKAHVDVQRFFMQALDEGVVKTNRNKEIDFKRSIIIATTNAGAMDLNRKPLGFMTDDTPTVRSTSEIMRILQASFDTELLNRFQNIIPFTSISEKAYTQILAVKYNQMIPEIQSNRKDLNLQPDSIDLEDALTNDVLLELSEKSYNPESNGRPAERTIRTYIEDKLLNNMNLTQFDLL